VTKRVDVASVQGVHDLLSLLEVDTEIILTEANAPVAKLEAISQVHIPENGRVPDMHPDIWVSNDFDEQVPVKYWNNRTL
jgi:hypothetical protein